MFFFFAFQYLTADSDVCVFKTIKQKLNQKQIPINDLFFHGGIHNATKYSLNFSIGK